MRFRSLLVITAIVSSILGATVVWLVLTVPNDSAAEALLKAARQSIEAHDNAGARATLTKIVQQYPRTDAAAAATVALVALGDQERQKLAADIVTMRKETQTQLASIQKKLDELSKPAPPPPTPPPVVAPAPLKKAPAQTPAKHHKSPKRRSGARRQPAGTVIVECAPCRKSSASSRFTAKSRASATVFLPRAWRAGSD